MLLVWRSMRHFSSSTTTISTGGTLLSRTIECIEQASINNTKRKSLKKDTQISVQVHLRGLSMPLVEAFSRFCCDSGKSLGSRAVSSPLPLHIHKWSVLSSPHVHKTAWTQLERRTHSRTVRVFGMHPELVKRYLWYLHEHAPPDVHLHCTMHDYIPATEFF